MIKDTPIRYGSFITEVINFLIIAFSIFLAVKYVNKLNEKLEKVGGKLTKKLGKNKEKEVEEEKL